MVDHYRDVIQFIAKFTIESLQASRPCAGAFKLINCNTVTLQMWQFAPNSVHYLLSLWQRMVASVPYVKGNFI